MQWKINLIRVIYLRMGKTTKAKLHWEKLRSPLLRIHYYQNKRLQVKGISVPNTNLQLNPYPNTQLDLQCSDNLSFQCTTSNMWLTNQCTNPSTWLTHQFEKDVGCKVLQFIQTMKIKKLLGCKTLGASSNFYKEYDELGQLSPVTICMYNNFASSCINLHHLWQPLK